MTNALSADVEVSVKVLASAEEATTYDPSVGPELKSTVNTSPIATPWFAKVTVIIVPAEPLPKMWPYAIENCGLAFASVAGLLAYMLRNSFDKINVEFSPLVLGSAIDGIYYVMTKVFLE